MSLKAGGMHFDHETSGNRSLCFLSGCFLADSLIAIVFHVANFTADFASDIY